MNCLPFLGQKMGGFLMRVDLRVKHDIEARKAAIGSSSSGHRQSAAIALSLRGSREKMAGDIPKHSSDAAAHGRKKQGRYTYEQKVAATSAVVDGGMTKAEAMAAFGMSMSPLKKWCALYRRGAAEALRPRPRAGRRGSGGRGPARRSSRSGAVGSRPRWPTCGNYAPWSRGTEL